MYTSLVPDSEANKRLLFRAAQAADGPLIDQVGFELKVTDLMITPAEKVDAKTGEAVPLIRVAVITKDGKVYEAFGVGAQKSVELLVTIYGNPPWKDGISLTVRKIPTTQGHTMCLEPFVAPATAPERRR
jgi:hypothetical protein